VDRRRDMGELYDALEEEGTDRPSMDMPRDHTSIRHENQLLKMLDDNKGRVVRRAGVTETKCHAVPYAM
jgi:hypothetical protein